MDECYAFLAYGSITSALVFFIVNPAWVNRVFTGYYRLDAYGNDPNYYGSYILVALAGVFYKSSKRTIKIPDYIVITLLVMLGFMTASKMVGLCIIGMLVVYIIITVRTLNKSARKMIVLMILFGGILFYVFREQVIFLFQRFILRFSETTGNTELGNLTSLRSETWGKYLNYLSREVLVLLLGMGVTYVQFFKHNFGMFIAHNTYFDMLLSWGVIGNLVLWILLYAFLKNTLVKIRRVPKYNFLPLMIFGLALLSLSCLLSDMFWYMSVLVLLPLKKSEYY